MRSSGLLWAPWRVEYFKEMKVPGCILCNKIKSRRDPDALILYRSSRTFIIMNKYPYNSGHLMVSPLRHVKDLEALGNAEMADLMATVTMSIGALKKALKPQGFNVGTNLGRVAGAGIEGHLHIHVVPRWNGDTNYMPVLAETKVIAEHLRGTYIRLRRYFPHD